MAVPAQAYSMGQPAGLAPEETAETKRVKAKKRCASVALAGCHERGRTTDRLMDDVSKRGTKLLTLGKAIEQHVPDGASVASGMALESLAGGHERVGTTDP